MKKPPPPPPPRQPPLVSSSVAAKRCLAAARNSVQKGRISSRLTPSRGSGAIEKQSVDTSSPRSVLSPIPDDRNSTKNPATSSATRSFVMKRLNDTIQVLTKESARLNPLSSNVKSGSDGLLLVSDQPNKYTTGASAREQQNPIHSDAAKSTDSTKAEVNLTFVELAGIAIAEGANKNSNILSR